MHMTMSKKLIGANVVLLAFTAAVGVVALREIGSVRASGDRVASSVLPGSDLVATIRLDAEAVRRREFELATVSDPKDRADTAGEIRTGIAKIGTELATYGRLYGSTGAARDQLAAARSAWDAYVTASAAAITDGLAGRQDAALAVLNPADQQWSAFEDRSDSWRKLAASQAATARSEISSTYSSARVLMFGLTGAAILLGLGIAFLLARSIRSRIAIVLDRLESLSSHCVSGLSSALGHMAEGDLTVDLQPATAPIDHVGSDEIGQTAAATNAIRARMIEAIAAYNRMRTSLATLVTEIASVAGDVSGSAENIAETSRESGRTIAEVASSIDGVAQGAER
jgi:methyl-accepting chemotaxis protein